MEACEAICSPNDLSHNTISIHPSLGGRGGERFAVQMIHLIIRYPSIHLCLVEEHAKRFAVQMLYLIIRYPFIHLCSGVEWNVMERYKPNMVFIKYQHGIIILNKTMKMRYSYWHRFNMLWYGDSEIVQESASRMLSVVAYVCPVLLIDSCPLLLGDCSDCGVQCYKSASRMLPVLLACPLLLIGCSDCRFSVINQPFRMLPVALACPLFLRDYSDFIVQFYKSASRMLPVALACPLFLRDYSDFTVQFYKSASRMLPVALACPLFLRDYSDFSVQFYNLPLGCCSSPRKIVVIVIFSVINLPLGCCPSPRRVLCFLRDCSDFTVQFYKSASRMLPVALASPESVKCGKILTKRNLTSLVSISTYGGSDGAASINDASITRRVIIDLNIVLENIILVCAFNSSSLVYIPPHQQQVEQWSKYADIRQRRAWPRQLGDYPLPP
ncbi:hypothetical protein J6590_043722 [Homalodisca vitripennis]|nr:hypothetical protein J6590_043722 [Homalodisca vitripennis]